MGDDQQRHLLLLAQLFEQLEDLALYGRVEGGGGLIGNQQARAAHGGERNQNTLAHPAGELVRIERHHLLRLADLHARQPGDRLFAQGASPQRRVQTMQIVLKLFAHSPRGIEGGERVLKHHRDIVAA